QLQQVARDTGLDITLYPGCEIYCVYEEPNEVLQGVLDGRYAPLGNSGYVLLEFNPGDSSRDIVEFIQEYIRLARELNVKPQRVLLAHAERYDDLCADTAALDRLRVMGVLIQINAYNLMEEQNEQRKENARRLLKEGRVFCIGSDAHRTYHREPNMESGIRYIFETCDEETAQAICYDNGKQLLLGQLG
ncbi:MAG: hypothetical protein Q4C54_08200, partial [Clostridia bacterium]|nr:hypothetical protein [Clostridia bacterium]